MVTKRSQNALCGYKRSRTPISFASRISAYIEEEVQRRLQDLHRVVGDGSGAPAETVKVSEGAGDLVIRFQDDLPVRSGGGGVGGVFYVLFLRKWRCKML